VRIALIAPPWLPVPPTSYGGTEAVIATLAEGLEEAGHDVLLVTTGDSTCNVDRTQVFATARPDDMHDVVVEVRHLLHAYDAVAAARVDIVHDHTSAGPVYFERYGAPVVTTNHNLFTDDTRALYRSVAGRVAIVAISHHQASTAEGVPIARVIHHGVDETRYPVGTGSGGYLLFLGRMSRTKGVHLAVDLARRVGVPLVIAAKMRAPDEHDYFRSEIAPFVGGGVTFAGEVGYHEKVELLGGATALVNPILWDEPFGLCMVEAMACGTPVITTWRGAAPEIVDHGTTGFLCRSLQDMVGAVDGVRSIDRRACRASVERRFSARRMTLDHIDLYERVQRDQRRPAFPGPATGSAAAGT
jgi:glycosyltransferase involved in cell wall biosynthesis